MLNGWISITDELPESSMSVLVWVGPSDSDHHGCTVGYFDRNNISQDARYIKTQSQWYDELGNRLYDVVAWQPLPFGPKGEAIVSHVLHWGRIDDARQPV